MDEDYISCVKETELFKSKKNFEAKKVCLHLERRDKNKAARCLQCSTFMPPDTVDYYIFFIKTAAPRIQNFLSNRYPDTEFPVQHCRSRIQNFLSSIVAPGYRISCPALAPWRQNFLCSISALDTKFPMQH